MLAYDVENPATVTTASILPHYQMSHHAHHLADQKGSNSSFFVIVLNVDIDDVHGGIVRGLGTLTFNNLIIHSFTSDQNVEAILASLKPLRSWFNASIAVEHVKEAILIQGLVLIEKILVDLLIGDAKLVAVGSVWSSPWKFHLVSCPKRLHVEPFLAEINSNTPLIASVQHVNNTPPAPTITKVRCMTYTIQTDDVPVQLTTTDRVTTTLPSGQLDLNVGTRLGLNGNKTRHYLNHCWQNREELLTSKHKLAQQDMFRWPNPPLAMVSWHANTNWPTKICSGGPIHPWLWSHGIQTQTGPPGYVPVAQSTPGYGLVASKHKPAQQDMFMLPNPPLAMVSWHPNTNWPNRICSVGPIHPWLWSHGIQTQTGPTGYVPVAQSTPGYGLMASKHKLAHQDMFRWPNPPLAMVSWHPNTSRPNRICSCCPIHPWLWSHGIQTQTGPTGYVPLAQSTPGYGLMASKHKLAQQDMFRWPNPPLAMVSWHPNTSRPNRICSGGPIHLWLWSHGIQTQTGPTGYVPVAQSTPAYGLVASKHKLAHQDMFRWPNPSLVMVLKQKEDSLVSKLYI
uniref:Uncharacterized protein n=1 Tax=Timema genevievae TaxID=629358 RepID=A0A7R9PLH2_TIMGE|nr:unnamed protein product [Timema genevievae]